MCILLTTWSFDFNLSLPSDFLLNFLFLILNPDHHERLQVSFSSSHEFQVLCRFSCIDSLVQTEAGSLFFAIKALPSPQSTTHPSKERRHNKQKQLQFLQWASLHQNQHKSNSPLPKRTWQSPPFQHSFKNIPIPHKRSVLLQTRIWS